jgi:hypothetical protein
VGFGIPHLDEQRTDELIVEIGLIARDAGDKILNNPEPARLYNVSFEQDDGTEDVRIGGFSVPAGIADEVAAQLASHGYSIE